MQCNNKTCENEAYFIPVLHVWGKSDGKKTGERALNILDYAVCDDHASVNASDYVPRPEMVEELKEALGDEPDLDNMVVQFIGQIGVPLEELGKIRAGEARAKANLGLKVRGTLRDANAETE